MKKLFLCLLFVSAFLSLMAQQDNQISQHVFNGLYINPAYSGYKEDFYIQSFYRMQWAGVEGAPKSFAVAADAPFNENKFGLGLVVSQDQTGAQSALKAYFNYSYRIRIGQDETSKLAFGLAAGVVQLGINGNKLQGLDPNDHTLPNGALSTMLPDANVGMFYSNQFFFAGISMTNILAKAVHKNRSNNMFIPIPQPHFYLTGGAIIALDNYDQIKFKPVFLYKDDFYSPPTVDFNAIFLFNQRFSFGAFYRTSFNIYKNNTLQQGLPRQNAVGGLAEFFATPNIRVGYSFDQALNKLGSYNYGSHELSIGFYLKPAKLNSAVRCYKF